MKQTIDNNIFVPGNQKTWIFDELSILKDNCLVNIASIGIPRVIYGQPGESRVK